MLKSGLKFRSLPIMVRTMKRNINYRLYSDRINKRMSSIDKKIFLENGCLSNNNKSIFSLYRKYDQYEIELSLLKKQIMDCSAHYSSKKIDTNIMSLQEQLNDNNDYFGTICEINKRINFIKLKMNKLWVLIEKKEKLSSDIKNKIKYYKKRLEVYTLYLDYLYDREEYRKKYIKNKEKVVK